MVLQTATSPFDARSIRVRIASSPMTDFLASSIASGGGSGTAYRPPVICRMNEPVSPVGGEYIANNPPTNDPALAFFRSIWPALFAAKEIRHHVAGGGFVQTQQDVVVAVENGDAGRHGHPLTGDSKSPRLATFPSIFRTAGFIASANRRGRQFELCYSGVIALPATATFPLAAGPLSARRAPCPIRNVGSFWSRPPASPRWPH